MKKGQKRREKQELGSLSEKKSKAQSSSATPLQQIKGMFETDGKVIFAEWRERLRQDERLISDPKKALLAIEKVSVLHKAVLTEDEKEVKAVFDKNASVEIDISSPTEDRSLLPAGSPLCWAATLGLISIIRLLKERGANPNWQNHPMSFAMRGNRPNVMEILLELGATFSPVTMEELAKLYIIPALEYAATDSLYWLFGKILAMGDEALVQKCVVLLWVAGLDDFASLIPRNQLENLLKEMCGNSFLIRSYICRFASNEAIQTLCNEKYQLTKFRNVDERNIAHSAAFYNTETVLAHLVEKHSKLLEGIDKFGAPPTAIAVRHDHLKALQIIDKRIKHALSWQDRNGFGLAHYAVKYQSIQILKHLADMKLVSSPDAKGSTPIVCAVQADQLAAVKIIHNVDEKQILWQERDSGCNLSHHAAACNSIKVSEYFAISHPKLWSAPDVQGLLPIVYAAQNSLGVLKIILKLDKSKIHWQGPGGVGLAHYASNSGSMAVLNYFAKECPELLYRPDGKTHTPLVVAISAGCYTAVEWFSQDEKRKERAFAWGNGALNVNLLHFVSKNCNFLDLSAEFIEEPETDAHKSHNETVQKAIDFLKIMRLLLRVLPKSSISQESNSNMTPLQMAKSPLFPAFVMLTNRDFFDRKIFMSSVIVSYHSRIVEFLSFYLFMCFAPKEAYHPKPEPSKPQSAIPEPLIAIISGYLIKTPMDFIFDEIITGENQAAKDKLISDAIHLLYDDRFQRLLKQEEKAVSSVTEKSEVNEQGKALNLLGSSATAIARKVEVHEYQERCQAQLLAEQWQQRQPSSSSSSSAVVDMKP